MRVAAARRHRQIEQAHHLGYRAALLFVLLEEEGGDSHEEQALAALPEIAVRARGRVGSREVRAHRVDYLRQRHAVRHAHRLDVHVQRQMRQVLAPRLDLPGLPDDGETAVVSALGVDVDARAVAGCRDEAGGKLQDDFPHGVRVRRVAHAHVHLAGGALVAHGFHCVSERAHRAFHELPVALRAKRLRLLTRRAFQPGVDVLERFLAAEFDVL